MRSKSFHKSSERKSLSKNNRSKYPSLLPGSHSPSLNQMMTSVKMLHTMVNTLLFRPMKMSLSELIGKV